MWPVILSSLSQKLIFGEYSASPNWMNGFSLSLEQPRWGWRLISAGPSSSLPTHLPRLIVSNTRQWHQWIQVAPPHLSGRQERESFACRWHVQTGQSEMNQNATQQFLLLWPNYASILLPSFFPHQLVRSHSNKFRMSFNGKVSPGSAIHCSFADLNWICWWIGCILKTLTWKWSTISWSETRRSRSTVLVASSPSGWCHGGTYLLTEHNNHYIQSQTAHVQQTSIKHIDPWGNSNHVYWKLLRSPRRLGATWINTKQEVKWNVAPDVLFPRCALVLVLKRQHEISCRCKSSAEHRVGMKVVALTVLWSSVLYSMLAGKNSFVFCSVLLESLPPPVFTVWSDINTKMRMTSSYIQPNHHKWHDINSARQLYYFLVGQFPVLL